LRCDTGRYLPAAAGQLAQPAPVWQDGGGAAGVLSGVSFGLFSFGLSLIEAYPSLYQPPPLSWKEVIDTNFRTGPLHCGQLFNGESLNFCCTSKTV
jgi:hypothetical protein